MSIFPDNFKEQLEKQVEEANKNRPEIKPSRNSALFWLPPLLENEIATPQTILIPFNYWDVFPIFDGERPAEFDRLCREVRKACEDIGYPVFIRTDLSSAKHDGPSSYKVNKLTNVPNIIYRTLEDSEMKFGFSPETPVAIMVRQWLDLESPFVAFYGHPISREWRFFADSHGVSCFHPYWPEESIEFFDEYEEPDNWRELLHSLYDVPENIEELKKIAVKAATLYGHKSSIDFARDVNGKWWLTDMAVAADSYHWPGCGMEK